MADQIKQYLLQMVIETKGGKVAKAEIQSFEGAVKQTGTTSQTTGRRVQSMSDIMLKAGKRALIVAPMWLALRSAMTFVIRTISTMIKSILDFDDAMARIETVVHGTARQIESNMNLIRSTILDAAVDTRASLEELSEAFYFLQTAGLSTEEALAGFAASINVMVGTNTKAAQTARILAGAYNTMGQFMGENLTVQEKFNKIADVLSFTFATQDVQMSELIESYTKLAPFVSGLSDSFTDLVTLLGFLNTRMLRAGRTGRLTGRTILQITKNARELNEIFGITFDPTQPINLVNTLEQISQKLQGTTKLTFAQQDALQRIFQTRGAVAPKLILSAMDDLRDAINRANIEADGFAERLKKIRERTIPAQLQRMSNVVKVLANDFFGTAAGTGDLAESLRLLNESLKDGRQYMRDLGVSVRFVFENIAQLLLILTTYQKHWDDANIGLKDTLLVIPAVRKQLKALNDAIEEMDKADIGFRGLDEIVKDTKKLMEELETEGEVRKKALKVQETQIKAQRTHRKVIQDTLKGLTGLLNEMGLSESMILEARIQMLQQNPMLISDAEKLAQLNELRLQQQIAFFRERKRETALQADLVTLYKKGNAEERKRLKRVAELRALPPIRLKQEIEGKDELISLVQEYRQFFDPRQIEIVNELLSAQYKDLLSIKEPWSAVTEEELENLKSMMKETVTDYWKTWDEAAVLSINLFGDQMKDTIEKVLASIDWPQFGVTPVGAPTVAPGAPPIPAIATGKGTPIAEGGFGVVTMDGETMGMGELAQDSFVTMEGITTKLEDFLSEQEKLIAKIAKGTKAPAKIDVKVEADLKANATEIASIVGSKVEEKLKRSTGFLGWVRDIFAKFVEEY